MPSGTVTSVGITNGGGLSVSGSPVTSSGSITVSHADTSSQASVNNSGRTYIQDITLDEYGHVTGISSATETVTNTDTSVTSAANHYTPSTESYTPTAGSAVSWSGSVITGITKDSKGHITGVTTGTIPAKPSYSASDVGALATGTTLDSIADGSTRKLANYVSKSGDTVNGTLTISPTNTSGTQDGIILNDRGTGASEGLKIK